MTTAGAIPALGGVVDEQRKIVIVVSIIDANSFIGARRGQLYEVAAYPDTASLVIGSAVICHVFPGNSQLVYLIPPIIPEVEPEDLIPTTIIRSGNQYTHWAQSKWMVFLPTTSRLTMWEIVAGVPTRMDQPNEPVLTINDADSRVSSDGQTVHIVYHKPRVGAGLPENIYYTTFDLVTETWSGVVETIASPIVSPWNVSSVSLSLDVADVPHVLYQALLGGVPCGVYKNRAGGVWSAQETVFQVGATVFQYWSLDHDLTDDSLHAVGLNNFLDLYHRRRPAAGPPWDAVALIDANSTYVPYPSIDAHIGVRHVGFVTQIAGINRIAHGEYIGGVWVNSYNLAPAISIWSNIILRSAADPIAYIVYKNTANRICYVKRPVGGAWGAEVQMAPSVGNQVSARMEGAAVIGALMGNGAGSPAQFFAFNNP